MNMLEIGEKNASGQGRGRTRVEVWKKMRFLAIFNRASSECKTGWWEPYRMGMGERDII